MFFIIITTAATLHGKGITNIGTASEAAKTLRPVVGNLAYLLFAAGIIGTGLLAVPILEKLSVKAKWGKLTDDDVTEVKGKAENLVGILQEKIWLQQR